MACDMACDWTGMSHDCVVIEVITDPVIEWIEREYVHVFVLVVGVFVG